MSPSHPMHTMGQLYCSHHHIPPHPTPVVGMFTCTTDSTYVRMGAHSYHYSPHNTVCARAQLGPARNWCRRGADSSGTFDGTVECMGLFPSEGCILGVWGDVQEEGLSCLFTCVCLAAVTSLHVVEREGPSSSTARGKQVCLVTHQLHTHSTFKQIHTGEQICNFGAYIIYTIHIAHPDSSICNTIMETIHVTAYT